MKCNIAHNSDNKKVAYCLPDYWKNQFCIYASETISDDYIFIERAVEYASNREVFNRRVILCDCIFYVYSRFSGRKSEYNELLLGIYEICIINPAGEYVTESFHDQDRIVYGDIDLRERNPTLKKLQ